MRKKYFYSNGKAVFIGNGLNRAFNDGLSWEELFDNANISDVPFSLKHSLFKNMSIGEVAKKLDNKKVTSDFQQYIFELIEMGFTTFLTTNFTYEIEYSLLPEKNRNYKTILNNTFSMKDERLDSGTSISNYIVIEYKNKSIVIIHLHGEIRKLSSLVFDHNKYCQLIGKISSFKEINSVFKLNTRGYASSTYPYKSFIEIFLLDDLYILGYGLDYSEYDIWWLLENRKRFSLKQHNKIYYFTCNNDLSKNKKLLLKNNEISLIETKTKPINNDYKSIYNEILNIIKGMNS